MRPVQAVHASARHAGGLGRLGCECVFELGHQPWHGYGVIVQKSDEMAARGIEQVLNQEVAAGGKAQVLWAAVKLDVAGGCGGEVCSEVLKVGTGRGVVQHQYPRRRRCARGQRLNAAQRLGSGVVVDEGVAHIGCAACGIGGGQVANDFRL